MPKINSGIFIMPFHELAKQVAQTYDEDLDFMNHADGLGFGEFWIGECHTMAFETGGRLRNQTSDLRKLLAEAGE